MLKNILASTALTALIAGPALAQMDPAQPDPLDAPATDSMGADISNAPAEDMDDDWADEQATLPEETDADMPTLGAGMGVTFAASDLLGADLVNHEGESIASVDELLIDGDGQVGMFLVDVGGFLGIGARTVAIPLSDVTMSHDEDADIVLRASLTREQLEALPEFDREM